MIKSDFSVVALRGLSGIPVHFGFSLLFLALLLVHLNSTGADFGAELVGFTLLLGSLYLHELGHAFALRLQGVRVHGITLGAGGGTVDHGPASGADTVLIAAMGPIANLTVWAIATLMVQVTPAGGAAWLLETLAFINLYIAALTLVPMMSLDGGKLVNAMLASVLPQKLANRVSGAIGLVFATIWVPVLILSFLLFGVTLLRMPEFDTHWDMLRQPDGRLGA